MRGDACASVASLPAKRWRPSHATAAADGFEGTFSEVRVVVAGKITHLGDTPSFALGAHLGSRRDSDVRRTLNVTTAPAEPTSARQGLLASHPLVSFFAMAYAFSWIVWAPWVLGEDGAGLLPIEISDSASGLLNAAAILAGPTLSAFIMTATTEGRAGVRRLLGRYVLWRVGVGWYAFALLGVPLIMLLGTMVYSMDLPNLGALGGPSYLLSYIAFFVLVTVLGGPLLEEGGWRGFALPRLERLHGPLVGSLILGVLWALWHLPEFLVPSWAASSGGGGIVGITLFTITAVTFTIVITWVFNNTRASLLLAILVHASIDTFGSALGEIFPARAVASVFPYMIGFGVVALVLIVLTRGRLDYGRIADAVSAPPRVR
jgi:membrane protease YdiL (CAAX protease family)